MIEGSPRRFLQNFIGWAAILAAASCQPAQSPQWGHSKSQLHFSASLAGATVNVLADGKSGSIDLQRQLAGAGVVGSQVIFSARNEKGIFLVIDYVSRSGTANADCRMGTEENLVWVAFDPSVRPINSTSMLIASCLQSVVVAQIQQEGGSIIVTSDSASQHLRQFVYFREASPESGFTFKQSELDQ
jgi:hypothetical protein